MSGGSATARRLIPLAYTGCIVQSRIFSTLLVVSLTVTLFAQNLGGSLRGEVQDASKARIAAANIEAECAATAFANGRTSEFLYQHLR